MITSKFNRRAVIGALLGMMLGVIASGGVSALQSSTLVPLSLTMIALGTLFCLGYLCWLRRITVYPDGIETRSVLLPFWRRFYFFTEFDYLETSRMREGEVLRLIRGGRRVMSIASAVYSNYEQLCEAIRVKQKEKFRARDNEEIVSEFRMPYIYGAWGFMLMALLFPLGCIMGGGEMTLGKVLFSLFGILFFGGITLTYLYSFKHITVWRGQMEVSSLLWPFRTRYYQMSDFDGCYYITITNDGQLGAQTEEARWLVKNGKVRLNIEERKYKNYEALKYATQTNYLGKLEMTAFQAMKYEFGKTLKL